MLNNRKSRTPNVQWKNCRNNCREWRSHCSPSNPGNGSFSVQRQPKLEHHSEVCLSSIILRWVLSLAWKSKHTLCIYLDIVWLWRFGTCSAVWFSMPRRVVEGPCQKCGTEIALLLINRIPFINQIPSTSRGQSSKSLALLWMLTNGQMWSSRRMWSKGSADARYRGGISRHVLQCCYT